MVLPQGDFTLLDLGCGDSHYLAHVLGTTGLSSKLSSYTGVDMSVTAMKVGAANLQQVLPSTCDLRHVEQDMLSHVQSCAPNSVDCVFASFAVHHLSVEEKAQLLQQVRRVLSPGGCFLLIDIFLQEGQDRQQYMQQYLPHIAEWGELTEKECADVTHHVGTFDFPEAFATYERWCHEGNLFSGLQRLCECRYYQTLAFEV